MRIIATTAAALALLGLPGAASAAPKETLMPTHPGAKAFQESVGFSDAVIHGDTIYLSGVVAGPRDGETDLRFAFERAFQRIERILQRAGATWDDVIVFDTFHTDLAGHIDAFVEVKNRFVKPPFPVWTAIQISALYEPTAVVEIKITARNPRAGADR